VKWRRFNRSNCIKVTSREPTTLLCCYPNDSTHDALGRCSAGFLVPLCPLWVIHGPCGRSHASMFVRFALPAQPVDSFQRALCAGQFAFLCDALVQFVRALDAIFELMTVVRELLGHFVDSARHIAIG
jgi:hypothetical protein